MDYREEYEAEIDLKDFLFYILRRWRSVLLAGLVFCVLLGAYKAVRSAGLPQEKLVPQKIRDYEFELAQYELDRASYEREIEDYSELLEHQKEYMEKSVLTQTDPYYKPVASADIFVKLDNTEWEGLPANLGIDPTDSIIKAYTSNIWSTLNWEPIETLTGGEKIYLEELLETDVDYDSNTFTILVVYSDGQTAQAILDIVLDQVLGRQKDINAGVGLHTIAIDNRSLSYSIDSYLAEQQRDAATTVTSYERSLLELRVKADDLEEPKKPFVIGFAKYPTAGFALGVLLMAAFYGIAYLLGGKLHGERSLQDMYGYAMLGALPHLQRKRFLFGIDCFLDRLAGVTAETEEEAYRRIALNVTNLAGGKKKILLTGTAALEKLNILSEAISQQLEGIELVTAADISLYADTLEALAECDAVLLAEEEGKSRISGIRKEHDSIEALGKPVIGYVLL